MWDLTVPGNNDHDFYVVPAGVVRDGSNGASRHTYSEAGSDTPVLVHNSGPCDAVLVPAGTQVFRSDTRDPATIFSKGFQPKGSNINLEEHVAGVSGVYTPESGYVSTTTSEAHAISRNGVTYTIDLPAGGIDVNATIEGNPLAQEYEVAFPGAIEPRYIVGARLSDGTWIPNPNYGK